MMSYEEFCQVWVSAEWNRHRELEPITCECGRQFETLRERFACEEGDHGRRPEAKIQ